MIKKFNEFIKKEKRIKSNLPIPNDIKNIAEAYIRANKDIFLVGGCVRDFIQGVKAKDYDLVTNALPNESKIILKDFNVSDEQGKNFGVIRVYTKDEPAGYEIASYRKDISKGRDTKGNDQKVELGKNVTIYDDCMRRDLTMNALFYDLKTNEIVDIVGGIEDIENKIVKCVGDPLKRFNEDRLRLMRIFRFSIRSNSKIDDITKKAILKDNRLSGISSEDDVSRERIFDELIKSYLQVKDYSLYLKLLDEFKMWKEIFPDLNINKKFVKLPNFELYIAFLLRDNDPNLLLNKLVDDLKFTKDISKRICFYISILSFKDEDCISFFKNKTILNIKNDSIKVWLETNNILNIPMFKALLDYSVTTSAEQLMKNGLKGKELGLAIKEIEKQKFKKLYEN